MESVCAKKERERDRRTGTMTDTEAKREKGKEKRKEYHYILSPQHNAWKLSIRRHKENEKKERTSTPASPRQPRHVVSQPGVNSLQQQVRPAVSSLSGLAYGTPRNEGR